ncbi:hypothetical protein D8I35_14550 [Corticibacter populi]|uniref:Acetyltransferase n=2 Tax=Corticibacter populi TaxID=1550736 RepID=A0A3M6QMJ1_9BURK|nr:hypothetical protein D8I35_14550 [Corticibacter populi]
MARKVVIYGASGHSKSIACGIQTGTDGWVQIGAFIEDGVLAGQNLLGVPVIDFENYRLHHLHLPCLVGVAQANSKRLLVEKVTTAGGTFPTLFKQQSPVGEITSVGEGTFISTFSHFAYGVNVGRHVQIMPLCSIGHDVVIGDFVTIAPSVTISGYVTIGDDAFIGAGAVIVQGTPERPLTIGKGAMVSAGAVVTKSIPDKTVVAGNPARTLRELAAASRPRRSRT